jgi:hypothetical protein
MKKGGRSSRPSRKSPIPSVLAEISELVVGQLRRTWKGGVAVEEGLAGVSKDARGRRIDLENTKYKLKTNLAKVSDAISHAIDITVERIAMRKRALVRIAYHSDVKQHAVPWSNRP